ncbi:MAG TPA: DUF3095 family protein [Magnetospirillaceae bacterium]|jgi:hypothetical protein
MDGSGSYYERLRPMRSAAAVLDHASYAPAPADWWLAVSDIKGSTDAVAEGRHGDVNFAAAAMIAALVNLCGTIPYQFGGDGAVALVPPQHAEAAKIALARTRSFAKREFGLDQRVGLAPVQALLDRNVQLFVAKYAPADGSTYAVFHGGGVELMEQSLKGRADESLARLATIDPALDDGEAPDLTGLSCRWTPIKSAHGQMVSLVIKTTDHAAIHAEIARIAGLGHDPRAVSVGALKARWPPKGFMREVRARKGKKALAPMMLAVALETILAYVVIRFRIKIGGFDPSAYMGDVADVAVDFARSDDNLYMVFDCPGDKVEAVRTFLTERSAKGDLRFGMSLSDHAVMTCLVVSLMDGRHVHFVDGGDGGYTRAASEFKAAKA